VIWEGLQAGRAAPPATIKKIDEYDRIQTIGYAGPIFSLNLEHAGKTAAAT
jgi:hypothetical protein